MKRFFRKPLYLLGICLLLVGGTFIFDRYFSTNARKSSANTEHVNMINTGMNETEVMKMMGMPDRIKTSVSGSVYYYALNSTDSMAIQILFDTSGRVTQKILPEN
jgi:outer membrane protein assembly factor BamE (lipoprotein component of BamABCDE complex)